MSAAFKRFRILLFGGALTWAATAAGAPPSAIGTAPLPPSYSKTTLASLNFVALPDAALARMTGAGLTPPAVGVQIPSRGRVALWDELVVKPADLGTNAGQVSITINSR